MATRTSVCVGAGNWSAAGTWDTKPAAGDDVIIADGSIVTIDEAVNIKTLTAAGNTGYIACATNQTLTLTGNTGITYAGTLTAGFIRVTANVLTITHNVGAGTVAVLASAAGYAIVTSSTGGMSVSNSGGKALQNTSSGIALSAGGSSKHEIVGSVECTSTGYAIYSSSTATTNTFQGSVISTAATFGFRIVGGGWTWTPGTPGVDVQGASGVYGGMFISGGTLTIAAVLTTANTSTSQSVAPILVRDGTVNYYGTFTQEAGTYCHIQLATGTLNLVQQGTGAHAPLILTNSGQFVVINQNGTLNLRDPHAANPAQITQQSTSACAAIIGTITTGSVAESIIGPVIPLATHVYPKGLGLAFGYAGAPVLGTLRASNIGALSEVASSEDLVAGDLADDVIVDDVTGTLAAGGGGGGARIIGG